VGGEGLTRRTGELTAPGGRERPPRMWGKFRCAAWRSATALGVAPQRDTAPRRAGSALCRL